MPAEPSKFASNQFDVATEGRFPLMSEILVTTLPKLIAASSLHVALSTSLSLVSTASAAWNAGEIVLANAEASQLGATILSTDKLASLTRKPDSETNSLIETWDMTIRGQVAYQSSVYTVLLPNGRETITAGPIDEQIDALRDFGARLTAQSAKPVLVTLGATVTAFATSARGLRTSQLGAKTAVDLARVAQETLRLNAAGELYSMVGVGMGVFKTTPAQVDSLFDVGLLRGTPQSIPAAPADTLWIPATHTLSTTVLPDGATRLEAWREGPGGAPELVAVGETDALSVEIPAAIVFTPGDLYDLWLQARNSRGSSGPGPVESWTAV